MFKYLPRSAFNNRATDPAKVSSMRIYSPFGLSEGHIYISSLPKTSEQKKVVLFRTISWLDTEEYIYSYRERYLGSPLTKIVFIILLGNIWEKVATSIKSFVFPGLPLFSDWLCKSRY